MDLSDPSEPVQLSRMREAIARRMAEANSSIPHFHLTTEARMGALLQLRGELNQLGDPELPKFSVTDFVMRAMALTLQRHPSLNAAWIGSGLRQFSQSNIALAVALPDGLVAPVLRAARPSPSRSWPVAPTTWPPGPRATACTPRSSQEATLRSAIWACSG
jgi:pyruvate dehydrogenase E2 component (dihydrolipoamide acetyltransferase)